jgi:GT2 family glycosyltransferase
VVVTHRGGPLLDACLASLRAQTRPVDELLVVVSNTQLPVDAPALQLGENVGYARAANAGGRATRGAIFLLNDDTRLDPDCVARLAARMDGEGVWQPRILQTDGRMDNLGHGLFPDGAVWARGRNGPAEADPGPPAGFSGAAVLISRGLWDAHGGFDERMGSFGEDVDLSLRLLRAGHRICVVHDAVVVHHLGASWGRTSPEKIRLIERNRVRAAVRSLPTAAVALLPATTLARYALYASLSLGGRGPGEGVGAEGRSAALRGLREGIGDIPEWWADRRRDRTRWVRDDVSMWQEMWRGRPRLADLLRRP